MSLTEKSGVDEVGTEYEVAYQSAYAELINMSATYNSSGRDAGKVSVYCRTDFYGSIEEFQNTLRELLEWAEKQTATDSQ